MGDVTQGKFKPRWPPSHLIVHLRELANKVERGEVTSLEAIFVQDGIIMYLHGANPELALDALVLAWPGPARAA